MLLRASASASAPALMVASCFAFAAMWALIRYAAADVPSTMAVLARYLVGTVIFCLLHARSLASVLGTRQIGSHIRRGIAGTVGTLTLFYAIAHAPMAQVLAINYAAPLFATIGAVLLLGERIRARRIAALIVGFAGVLIVLRPGHIPLSPGIIAAVVAALAVAAAVMSIKQLVGGDSATTVVGWSFILPLPVIFLIALLDWQWPQLATLPLLVGIGLFAYLGQVLMTRSFALADATAVMPYDFVRFLLITLVGVLLFDEGVDAATIAGGTIIFASSVYLAYREAVAARPARVAGQPHPLD